jgi:PIN domain
MDKGKYVSAKSVLDTLLFVDTNVLLDFYRIRKANISIKYLKQLEACRDRLIIGSQIEMEYKKNRQRVILESLNNYGTPDLGRLTAPAIISHLQVVKMIESKKEELKSQKKKVDEKIQKILSDPTRNDPVYQCLQRLFKNDSQFNLSRKRKERLSIRNLAKKRFVLGYPPRKQGDTSIGDAINWEWIIQCSINSSKHVVIVTRDTDYGAIYDDISYLNDWLKQEFSERVSNRRKIILTDKLSYGLKVVHASVTKEMEDEEKSLLAEFFTEEDLSRLLQEKSSSH